MPIGSEKERIDEIGFGGMKLIQSPAEFCYGIDAVLLADFAGAVIGGKEKPPVQHGVARTEETEKNGVCIESSGNKRAGLAADLGTGNGIVPLLLAHKTGLGKIYGVEVQEGPAERAVRSVKLNGLDGRISIARMDLLELIRTSEERQALKRKETTENDSESEAKKTAKDGSRLLTGGAAPVKTVTAEEKRSERTEDAEEANNREIRELFSLKGSFDLVTANPPYFPREGGIRNLESALAIARMETTASLGDFMRAASGLLKKRAPFCMVHRPTRLTDLLISARAADLEPKLVRFIRPRKDEEPNLVLLSFVKSGGRELHYLPDLVVYGEDGRYTEEVLRIYERIG